jgi:hypothetical protein
MRVEGRCGVKKVMRHQLSASGVTRGRVLVASGLLLAFGLGVTPLSLRAQEHPHHAHAGSGPATHGSDDPLQAWATIQQTVKDMETAVRSKNLGGVHEPSMKIRPAIRALKAHSGMLSGDQGQKLGASLKQLDGSVTDLHSAADEGSQPKAETALRGLESALDQLKAQDPETAFKHTH